MGINRHPQQAHDDLAKPGVGRDTVWLSSGGVVTCINVRGGAGCFRGEHVTTRSHRDVHSSPPPSLFRARARTCSLSIFLSLPLSSALCACGPQHNLRDDSTSKPLKQIVHSLPGLRRSLCHTVCMRTRIRTNRTDRTYIHIHTGNMQCKTMAHTRQNAQTPPGSTWHSGSEQMPRPRQKTPCAHTRRRTWSEQSPAAPTHMTCLKQHLHTCLPASAPPSA